MTGCLAHFHDKGNLLICEIRKNTTYVFFGISWNIIFTKSKTTLPIMETCTCTLKLFVVYQYLTSTCLFVCISMYVCMYVDIYLSIYIYLSFDLSVCLSIYLYFYLLTPQKVVKIVFVFFSTKNVREYNKYFDFHPPPPKKKNL